MKKVIFILLLFCLFVTKVFSVEYFEFQVSGTTNTLKSITFVNQNTGIAVGNSSTIVRTSNGGINWNEIDVSSSTVSYTCVAFANSTTAFAVSDAHELLKTTNAGLNWTVSSLGSYQLKYVYFLNSSMGFITGENAALFKTTNGGQNWIDLSLGIPETIVKISFYDEANGFFLTRQYLDSGSVYKTTNGGINWQRQNNFYSGYSGERALFDCVMLSKDTVYISLGYYQTGIMRSTNGGSNWQYIYNQWQTFIYPGSLYELFFVDRNTVIAMNGPTDGATCYLIKSTNAGFNFTHPSAIRLSGYMYDGFFFRDSYTAYFCGEGGRIIKVYSYVTGVQNNALQTNNNGNNFSIYGSPTGDVLYINSEQNNDNSEFDFEANIFDSLGRIIKKEKINTNNYALNIASFSSGIYYIKISSNGKDYLNKKFIKIR
ncbi:MAG: T9SS type A sorting domain-containing protein [Bacteroidetes bacterium]|mgnify:CR=1 FL=1|nr:T9SS type A sorting domain-containing protein [Bacteroidota bacterium]